MVFKKTILAATVAFSVFAITPAQGSLIYLGTITQQGSGIGSEFTILNFHGQGTNPTPSARVIRSGAADQVDAGANTTIAGGANNQTRTFGEASIDDANEFRLLFNVNEPDNSVTITALQVAFYLPNNTLFHVANLDFSTCPGGGPTCILPEVGGGIGGNDHVFGLNPNIAIGESQSQQTTINSVWSTGLRVGVGTPTAFTAHSSEAGGFESYALGRFPVAGGVGSVPGAPVPEPSSMLLLGAGLVGVAARLRRRFRK